MAQIKGPAGGADACAFRYIRKSAVAVIVKYNHSAAVVGVLKTFREEPGRAGMEDVDGLEIAANKKINKAIIVVVERNRLDGVHVAVKPGFFGYIAKFSISQIFIEDAVAKANHEKVGQTIIVVVKPERAGGGVFLVVAIGYAGFLRHVREGKVAVISIEMVFARGA